MKNNFLINKNIIYSIGYSLLLFLSIVYSIHCGNISVEPSKIMDILLWNFGVGDVPYWTRTEHFIVWDLRLPRTILACLAGAGLAVSGVAMQAAVKNPLADPYILGISAGASMGATAVIAADLLDITADYSVAMGAFSGAMLSMLLLFFLNRGKADSVRLLLSGCVISILFSSVSSVIMFLAKDKDKISSVVFWLMGSAADATWKMIPLVALTVILCIVMLLLFYRQLNAMLLGEETAHTLSVNTKKLRWYLVVMVAIVVGSIVAFCGMIGFVGFVIPHIVRSFFGANHKTVVPISAAIGSLFMLWCDLAARTVANPEELPLGIITAITGAPFFIYILYRRAYAFGGK